MSNPKEPQQLSSSVCKKERGDLFAFRIVVIEYRIENSFHTTSVTKDPHRPRSSLYLPKRSFYKIGGADLPPQGLLGFLKLLGIQPLSLLCRKFHLIKREQIVDL